MTIRIEMKEKGLLKLFEYSTQGSGEGGNIPLLKNIGGKDYLFIGEHLHSLELGEIDTLPEGYIVTNISEENYSLEYERINDKSELESLSVQLLMER